MKTNENRRDFLCKLFGIAAIGSIPKEIISNNISTLSRPIYGYCVPGTVFYEKHNAKAILIGMLDE